jgi:hypothetical protein
MKARIVTTMGPGGWDLYGRRFVESYLRFWPAKIELAVYFHHCSPPLDMPKSVLVRQLDQLEGFKRIVEAFPNAKDGPSLGYAFKAIALADAVEPELDWVAFVDADTETMRPVDGRLLSHLFDDAAHLTYLYRKSVSESEGSWFAFNLRTPEGASLLSDYYGLYTSLEAFQYKKAHDNAVLDRLVAIHRAHNLKVVNLAPGALGLDAFHQSPLGGYMVHYKGPNKATIASPAMAVPSRYLVVADIAKHALANKPEAPHSIKIVEVGTWNGSRAIHLAETLFEAGATHIEYVGFDTFDDGNDRVVEGHTKPHATHLHVKHRLENYATVMARYGKIFEPTLVKGNTLKTLPDCKALVVDAHFAYIDGGHSYETVKSDYENLAHVPYIVFDDIILNEEAGAPEGPRRVFTEHVVGQKQAYNSGDPYAGLSQTITLGVVAKPGFVPMQFKQQLVVQPVDSVDKTEQFEHIATNTKLMPEWIGVSQAHQRKALLVSAGPTLPQFIEDIRQKQAAGAVVFAVKHAYPMLKAAGITPDFTVILDPRPVTGTSTHGIVRTELFKDLGAGEKILLATMTHPSVTELLMERGARLLGWHAYTQGTQNANLAEMKVGLTVSGGTCAATRLPMLAFTMGFRRFDFYGYDFYYEEGTDPSKLKQQLMQVMVGPNQQKFWTTGELVAAMQDLGHWVKWMVDNRLSVKFHGTGAGAAIWASTVKNYESPGEYPY